MAVGGKKQQPGLDPAEVDRNFDIELDRLAAAKVEDLRGLWRERHGQDAPVALSKDLMARALAHAVQEERFGGLDPRPRRLLDRQVLSPTEPGRHVKVGSIIVREHAGVVHEVMVVPGGFFWQGKTFASLSTIAKRITGTTWNGPRFFGLRGASAEAVASNFDATSPPGASKEKIEPLARRVRIGGVRRRPRGQEATS